MEALLADPLIRFILWGVAIIIGLCLLPYIFIFLGIVITFVVGTCAIIFAPILNQWDKYKRKRDDKRREKDRLARKELEERR